MNIVEQKIGETVQNAIDRAKSGDIVQILPGEHKGPIFINKENITLFGTVLASTFIAKFNHDASN